ncbi:MAG TPA: trypsin-like peptidase domain-containing protein [Gemmatimonadales bacterium]|jgi:serine protease Do
MAITSFAALSALPIAEELEHVAAALREVTVRVRIGGSGEGAGVLWRPDGIVVTNAHVARGRAGEVRLPDGRTVDATLAARDARLDLAALRIPAGTYPIAAHCEATSLVPGALVLAFGHPLGVPNALSLGVVHHVASDDSGEPRWIRADIRLSPGNSGGPLADAHGRVVGINTLVAGGLGYALPLNIVARFLEWAGLTTPGRRAA